MLPPDLGITADRIAGAGERLGTLLRAAGDLERPALGEWSARDVAAHVAWEIETYTLMLEGASRTADSVAGIAGLNAEGVAEVQERDGAALADRLAEAMVGYLAAARGLKDDGLLRWHAGLDLPASTLLGLHLGELLIHGYDIASAVDQRWSIPGDEAAMVVRGLTPIFPHYLDEEAARGFRGRFDIRLRGQPETRVVLAIADGVLEVREPGAERVDCVISADPASFLLVNYGRKRPLGPALTGKIVAWGRKPWLGFKLPQLFRSP